MLDHILLDKDFDSREVDGFNTQLQPYELYKEETDSAWYPYGIEKLTYIGEPYMSYNYKLYESNPYGDPYNDQLNKLSNSFDFAFTYTDDLEFEGAEAILHDTGAWKDQRLEIDQLSYEIIATDEPNTYEDSLCTKQFDIPERQSLTQFYVLDNQYSKKIINENPDFSSNGLCVKDEVGAGNIEELIFQNAFGQNSLLLAQNQPLQ
ncbi:unnamed protein product, partial [marine sediment metagenome]